MRHDWRRAAGTTGEDPSSAAAPAPVGSARRLRGPQVTDPPQGRDGSPSVAALAVHVNGLRRDLDSLTTQVDALTSTQQEHAAVLDGIAELRDQVEQILAILAEDDEASPADWFWLTMNDQARDEKFSELSDWVETVLRAQYPDYLADQIRPCWPNHPEARWELAWLYQLWSRRLPGQTTSAERRRRLARPLVPRRHPPPRHSHEPMRRLLPTATQKR